MVDFFLFWMAVMKRMTGVEFSLLLFSTNLSHQMQSSATQTAKERLQFGKVSQTQARIQELVKGGALLIIFF